MSPEGKIHILQPERVMSLQIILAQQNDGPVSLEEAQEVGESILNFFEALANEQEEG